MSSKFVKIITTLIFYCCGLTALANSSVVNAASHHDLMGSHGMVLILDENEGFFASHLPLYSSPHNYQIIYKVKVENPKLLAGYLQKGMVTVLPDRFDLTKLIKGESFSINTAFFQGHFERGGKQVVSANMIFENPVLIEKVSTTFKSKNAHFYTVPISESTAIFAHKIQRSPSFDAIGFLNKKMDQVTAIHEGSSKSNNPELSNSSNSSNSSDMKTCIMPAILESAQIKKQLANCAKFQWKYIETQDFK